MGLKPKRGAKVFADLNELDDDGGRMMPALDVRPLKPLAPLVRPQHSTNPSRNNGLHFEAMKKAARPRRPKPEVKFGAKRAFGRARLDGPLKPELAATMRKTLSRAAEQAAATLRAIGDLTPRGGGGGGGGERWAKFWEPGQRCYYFVSSKSGESRWAAHFDDDVMVVESPDGVAYVHHATGAPVAGPTEASVASSSPSARTTSERGRPEHPKGS